MVASTLRVSSPGDTNDATTFPVGDFPGDPPYSENSLFSTDDLASGANSAILCARASTSNRLQSVSRFKSHYRSPHRRSHHRPRVAHRASSSSSSFARRPERPGVVARAPTFNNSVSSPVVDVPSSSRRRDVPRPSCARVARAPSSFSRLRPLMTRRRALRRRDASTADRSRFFRVPRARARLARDLRARGRRRETFALGSSRVGGRAAVARGGVRRGGRG